MVPVLQYAGHLWDHLSYRWQSSHCNTPHIPHTPHTLHAPHTTTHLTLQTSHTTLLTPLHTQVLPPHSSHFPNSYTLVDKTEFTVSGVVDELEPSYLDLCSLWVQDTMFGEWKDYYWFFHYLIDYFERKITIGGNHGCIAFPQICSNQKKNIIQVLLLQKHMQSKGLTTLYTLPPFLHTPYSSPSYTCHSSHSQTQDTLHSLTLMFPQVVLWLMEVWHQSQEKRWYFPSSTSLFICG